MEEQENYKSLIIEIKELLEEVIEEQKNLGKDIENKYKVTMKKLDKINEYNRIEDMTNQVFERRMSAIEENVSKLLKVDK